MNLNMMLKFIFILACCHCGFLANAQSRVDRICTTGRFSDQCAQLQRGTSEVNCQHVQDSIECAQRLRNGTADFGVFSAETALLLASLKWDGLVVVKEQRHRDQLNRNVDYESVVVVHANHQNGIDGLNGLNYCHPGLYYDRTERWSERFLKYFERSVVPIDCEKVDATASPAEIETAALATFFQKACRPGSWSNNIEEDAKLKAKYPQLCELCTSSKNTCAYDIDIDVGNNLPISRHIQALRCLLNKGQVAYVSSQDAQAFFSPQSGYSDLSERFAYLCPNGTLQSVTANTSPCVWLRQPWPLIITNDVKPIEVSSRLNNWVRGLSPINWETAIREILTADSFMPVDTTIQKPEDFFRPYREVPYSQSMCLTHSTWCTTSQEEKDKCEVTRAAGITTGVYPLIDCLEPVSDTVSCLKEINKGRADFTGIDSHFGFIARYPYNLTTAMYAETETEKYASVVVAIHANSKFERFENLRNAKACFGEFGSIASVAFINTGKNRGFFRKSQCHYGNLLGEFFGPSCAPGALDLNHDPKGKLDSLCSLCRPSIGSSETVIPSSFNGDTSPPLIHISESMQNASQQPLQTPSDRSRQLNCNADYTNGFYGNRGALMCLRDVGDVAILEQQYLNEDVEALGIDPNEYRIICRNGSLANYLGFNVDPECALTTIVDGEIVVAHSNRKTNGIINALSSFDKYFQSDPDFKMYNVFAGHKDLLFKDSTIGLVARNEENLGQQVENYKKLFENLDACVQGNAAFTFQANIVINLLASFVSYQISRFLIFN